MTQKNNIVARCCLAVGGFLAAFIAGPIGGTAMAADGATSLVPCPPPQLSQLFVSFNDTGWYTLLPGETTAGFDGARWRFDGGARIATAALSDGRTGRVLDLPGGSSAVSPPVCVSPDFTTVRAMARMVAPNQAVTVFVSVAGSEHYIGLLTSSGRGWNPSDPLPLQSAITGTSQRVQFRLVANREPGHTQIYNFALDPRMK